MNKKILLAILSASALFASAGTTHAQEAFSPIPQVTDEWRFSVSPYGWIPQVNTTVSAGGAGSKNADISMNNLLSNLKSGAMIAGEAHYGKWGVLADFATATLQKSGSFNFKGDPAYRAGDKSTLQASLFNLMGSYTVFNNQDAYVDALLGVRWVGLTTSYDVALQADPSVRENVSSAMHATYGVVGFNSRYRILGSNWYVPLYADIGTAGGPNHQTWQASTGVGVALSKMVDLSLTYRAIGFEIKSGNNDSTLLKGIFHGPQVMATFNF
ncbi:hypothetical protein [Polynucleobacter sp. MG-27-Goln-C1]|uniref:hypothetical protein n=1 Tax=Polynucleobacter sp. MG-27-Goln-C1 TaxID=1819726 RepID=UPI001C0C6EFB|nr:hypothetical protein [Polynucleobacter sp. MG-27-Goln-C1]MBU3612132.1 hypothetical protein [Polynucleobacter sp. MG-27-Goln-C1]